MSKHKFSYYHCITIELNSFHSHGKLNGASSNRPIVRLPHYLIGLSIIAQSSRPNFSFDPSLSFFLSRFSAKCRMEDKT